MRNPRFYVFGKIPMADEISWDVEVNMVNGSLQKYCLYDLRVHFGCFPTVPGVDIQQLLWPNAYTP